MKDTQHIFVFGKDKKSVEETASALENVGCRVESRTEFADAVKVVSDSIFDAVVIHSDVHDDERMRVKEMAHEHSPRAEVIDHMDDISALPQRIQKADFDLSV